MTLAPEARWQILGCMTAVIVLDYLAMFFAKPVIKVLGLPLALLGVVSAYLQIALSLQIVIFAIRIMLQTPVNHEPYR